MLLRVWNSVEHACLIQNLLNKQQSVANLLARMNGAPSNVHNMGSAWQLGEHNSMPPIVFRPCASWLGM